MERGRRSAVGLAYSFAGQGAQVLLQVVVFVVLARLLAPEDFGLVAASLVVVNVGMLLATAGLRTALVQLPAMEAAHLRTAMSVQLVLACSVFGSVTLGAPALADLFRMPDLVPVLQLMALAHLVRCFALGDAVLLREQRLKELAGIEVGCYALGFGVVTVVLAGAGAGVWAVVVGHLVQSVLRTSALWWRSGMSPRLGASPRHARELLRIGAGSTLAQGADILAWEGDNFVVGRWLGAGALGFYERAYRLMIVPAGLFGQSMWNVLFPQMSRGQDDRERLRRLFTFSTAAMALLTLPLAVLLSLEAQELVALVLGPQWEPLEQVFQVLVFAVFFRASFYVTDSLIVATGHVYRHAARRLLFAVTVIGGALLGQRWGLQGVAACVLLALALNFVVMVRLSLELLELPWHRYLLAYVPAVQVCAAVAVVVVPAVLALRALDLPALVVAAGGCAGALLGALGAVRVAAAAGRGGALVAFVEDVGRVALRGGAPAWLVPPRPAEAAA